MLAVCYQFSSDGSTQPKITRSKEEAIELLQGYAQEINGSPDKFGQLAKVHSDCSSHANSGDLGFFKPVSLRSAHCIRMVLLTGVSE